MATFNQYMFVNNIYKYSSLYLNTIWFVNNIKNLLLGLNHMLHADAFIRLFSCFWLFTEEHNT